MTETTRLEKAASIIHTLREARDAWAQVRTAEGRRMAEESAKKTQAAIDGFLMAFPELTGRELRPLFHDVDTFTAVRCRMFSLRARQMPVDDALHYLSAFLNED